MQIEAYMHRESSQVESIGSQCPLVGRDSCSTSCEECEGSNAGVGEWAQNGLQKIDELSLDVALEGSCPRLVFGQATQELPHDPGSF